MRAKSNVTFEIEESMAQLLAPQYIEKQASSNNVADAMVSLLKAAEIFENLEMFVAAEVVTKVLEQIPPKKKAIASVWRVTTRHTDGEHELADGLGSYEEAKATAERWLGGANYWTDETSSQPKRAVDDHGGVLEIEERAAQLTPFAEKVWEAVSYSWLTHEDDLFRDANQIETAESNERGSGNPKDPFLYHLLAGAPKDEIKKAIDELIEKGFVKYRELKSERK